MDIIQAWKKCKDVQGKYIFRRSNPNNKIPNVGTELACFVGASKDAKVYMDDDVCADDWEVERKPLVLETEAEWICDEFIRPTGKDMRQKLMPFHGKRTRIKIEEIIE